VKAYKAAAGRVALALREMLSPEQAAALAAGDLDFGLLLTARFRRRRLEHLVVQRDRLRGRASFAPPSRRRAAVGFAVSALASEAFVMVPREIAHPPVRYS